MAKGTPHEAWADQKGVEISNVEDGYYWWRLESREEVEMFIRDIREAANEAFKDVDEVAGETDP